MGMEGTVAKDALSQPSWKVTGCFWMDGFAAGGRKDPPLGGSRAARLVTRLLQSGYYEELART